MPSLRRKVTAGYYLFSATLVALALSSYLDLRYLEERIRRGTVVADFVDTVLEMRRYEKNYLLYAQARERAEAADHAGRAAGLLAEQRAAFAQVIEPARLRAVEAAIGDYRALLVAGPGGSGPALWEARVREVGHGLSNEADAIRAAERAALAATLTRSRTALVVSVALLVAVGLVIGRILARATVRPLQRMEEDLRAIGEGRCDHLEPSSRDGEILSVAEAVNRMLRELEARRRHLLQAEKLAALGTLVSGVAHELNNPLANISSSSQILAEELDSGDREFLREMVGQIDEQVDRSRAIVRSLLELSRDRPFRKEPVAVARLLADTRRFIRGQVPAGVELRVEAPEGLSILGDRRRLQQLFINLTRNAVEAAGEQGRVLIAARRVTADATPAADTLHDHGNLFGKCAADGEAVELEVRDSGPGIPPELLTRIFEPFFTTKDVGKGYGLGLAIAHEVVEEHEGCIAVRSRPGEGTAFVVRLPTA